MRKLFISADMEGCAAVSSRYALASDQWEWAAARRWMTQDVIAVAEAAFATGYDEVLVADGHGNAHNVDPDSLPDNIRLIRSWPRPLLQMQGVQEPGVQACAFVGYHAGSTERRGVLRHTYHGGAYRSIKLNGVVCSEGYLNAALAGEFGRPIVFVAGDQQTIEDARRYAPEAVGFVTKEAIGIRSGASLPPAQVRRAMKMAMTGALSRPLPSPFVLRGPFRLEIETTTQLAAEMLAYLPAVEQTGSFEIGVNFDRIEAAMRFICFAMLYSPTGVIAL